MNQNWLNMQNHFVYIFSPFASLFWQLESDGILRKRNSPQLVKTSWVLLISEAVSQRHSVLNFNLMEVFNSFICLLFWLTERRASTWKNCFCWHKYSISISRFWDWDGAQWTEAKGKGLLKFLIWIPKWLYFYFMNKPKQFYHIGLESKQIICIAAVQTQWTTTSFGWLCTYVLCIYHCHVALIT